MSVQRLCLALAAWVGLALTGAPAHAEPASVTVFAASSLTNSLNAVGQAFTTETGVPVRFSFAASSAIARQIEAGAPADVVFTADAEWMDYLQSRSLVQSPSRVDLLSNRLALIAPVDSPIRVTIQPNFALAKALGDNGRLATGDPASVPVGRYAKAALTRLGVWDQVSERLVRAENVRSAMVFVSRGEVPLGIVYQTDALIDPKVRIVALFPESSHPKIIYPAALTVKSGRDARRFLDWAKGSNGQAIFRKFGFKPL